MLASVHLSSSNLIALGALAFTIATFWWLNARRGQLTAMRPRAYAFARSGDLLRLRLPLVLFNTGAPSYPVADLKIVVETEPDQPTLRWLATTDQLGPRSDEHRSFAAPFALAGRDAREVIAEFEPSAGFDWAPPEGTSQQLRLQALTRTGRKEKWIDLTTFDWWPPPEDKRSHYIAHRNEKVGGGAGPLAGSSA